MTTNAHTLNALAVVADILGRRPDLAAVHTVSTHGNNGRKGLINIRVNPADLPAWADELGDADWVKSTRPGAAVIAVHNGYAITVYAAADTWMDEE